MAIKFLNSGIFTGSVSATDGNFSGTLSVDTIRDSNAELVLRRESANNVIRLGSGVVLDEIKLYSGGALSLSLNSDKSATFASSVELGSDAKIARSAGGYTFLENAGGGLRASMKSNSLNQLIFSTANNIEALRLNHINQSATFASSVSATALNLTGNSINFNGQANQWKTYTAVNDFIIRDVTNSSDVFRLYNTTGAATFASSVSAGGAVTGSNLSGTNTGDQDLSGYALTSALNGYLTNNASDTLQQDQNADTSLTIRNNTNGTAGSASLDLRTSGNNFDLTNYSDLFTGKLNVTEFKSSAGGSSFQFSPASTTVMEMTATAVTVTGNISATNLSGTNTGDNPGVTSVGISHAGDAFTVGSAVTTSGTLAITMAGNATQYINGQGNLITFPSPSATNLGYTTAATTGVVTSSTGTNATLPAATTALAGLLTGVDKTKLDGIATGAQVNVATNLTKTTSVTDVTINSSTGANVAIGAATTSVAGVMTKALYDNVIANNAKVSNVTTNLGYTASTTNGVVTSSDGTNATLPLVVSNGNAGLMTGGDKLKLDGIAAGAQVNVATNLGITAGTTAGPIVTSSTGTNATLPTASATASGVVTTGTQTWAGAKTFSSTITGSISGNAGTVTARTIALSGAATGTATSFNGSANITIPVTALNASNLNTGTVPDARLTGTYSGITLQTNGGNTHYTTPNTGSSSTNDRTVFGLAQYKSDSSNATGAIVFYAPNTNTSIMHRLRIEGMIYSNGPTVACIIQGYRTTGAWSQATKVNLGISDIQVRFAVDATGKNCIILGDVATTWSYPMMAITHAMFSHSGATDAYCKDWTVGLVTSLTGFTQITGTVTSTAITTSVTGNSGTATTLQNARTINGVSFNGSGNITVEPYVEDAVATSATRYITFVDNSTAGYKRLNEDANLSYNPGSNTLTVPNGIFTSNVGIGTTNPIAPLHVSGSALFTSGLYLGTNTNSATTPYIFNYGSSLHLYSSIGSTINLGGGIGNQQNNVSVGNGSLIVSGNIGIGTTSPDTKLDLISGTNNGIRISATDTTNNWRDINIRSYVSQSEANALPEGIAIFTTNPSGQSDPAFSKYGGTVIQCRNDGNSSFAVRVGSGLTTAFFINNNASATFSSTVTATNFILSSDERLKDNIKEIDTKHIDVNWKNFELKSEPGVKRTGVIAQELEINHPEFVRTDDEGMKSVAYIDLLIAKIAELEARLEKLEK